MRLTILCENQPTNLTSWLQTLSTKFRPIPRTKQDAHVKKTNLDNQDNQDNPTTSKTRRTTLLHP